jgi:hypothetical protein
MGGNGWLKLHRELFEKAIWKASTPEQKVILITILGMVNYKCNSWEWQGEKFDLKPGQVITSLESIQKEAGKGISIQNIRTSIKKFENYGFLTNKSTKTGRLITVVNWELYQSNDEELTKITTNSQQTANKQLTTKEESKKEKKINKVQFGEFSNVKLSEIEHKKLIDQYGDRVTQDFIEKLDAYVESTGKKYKSHYATILNWIRKEPGIKKTDQKKPIMTIDA